MCPMRFILVFFSAALAAYLAWTTARSSDQYELAVSENSTPEKVRSKQETEFNFVKALQNGFWVFIDMASGRYLWRNAKQLNSKSTCLESR